MDQNPIVKQNAQLRHCAKSLKVGNWVNQSTEKTEEKLNESRW